jgi:hypothetical protein
MFSDFVVILLTFSAILGFLLIVENQRKGHGRDKKSKKVI